MSDAHAGMGTQGDAGLMIDAAVARDLEAAEAEASRAFCEAAAELYPGKGIRVIAAGGGYGLHYGAGDPLNAVKGVGLRGAVDVGEWDALEEAFGAAGSPVVIDLSPFADDTNPRRISCAYGA